MARPLLPLVLSLAASLPIIALAQSRSAAQGDDHARQGTDGGQVAWTTDAALAQLRLYPQDLYLQHVALQLGRREGRLQEVQREITRLNGRPRRTGRQRLDQVDLFNIFTGALAVQESLQLETLSGTGDGQNQAGAGPPAMAAVAGTVPVSALSGPTIKSHPWTEMLAGRQPAMSPLADCVPADFYYARFTSLRCLFELMDTSDLWGTHLFSQTKRTAYRRSVGERLQRQLALELDDALRPVAEQSLEEIVVTGSDLFVPDGSDVTVLLRSRRPELFRPAMEALLIQAQSKTDGVERSTGEYQGVVYVKLASPDRSVHVFAAQPKPDVWVRSNSEVAFRRVMDCMSADGRSAPQRLSDTDEFAYIRTLMTYGAETEDAFVYLSDPFIRRMVGPELKLTQRRRLLCAANLRVISQGAVLFQTQEGRPATALRELAERDCIPQTLVYGERACPCGGSYALADDGRTAVCSHHGRSTSLVPCCEIALEKVTSAEAEAYRNFVTQYNRYWRTFFDPIALRVQLTPKKYRLETIILPLIDNSIYRGLSEVLGGTPVQLDHLPVPERNIFTVAAKINKRRLMAEAGWIEPPAPVTPEERVEADVRGSAENLQRIGLAMHNYHDTYRKFPAVANFKETGGKEQPLLSWRVHLLPFLGEQALYAKFHLGEPWDSPHNKTLIEQMPSVYFSPGRKAARPGTTTYVLPVGKEMIFKGTSSQTTIASIRDGTSNTIMVMDVPEDQAVVWTKPDDLRCDRQTTRQVLFRRFAPAELALACFADGSVRRLPATLTADQLWPLLTCAGGELATETGQFVGRRRRSSPFGLYGLTRGRLNDRQLYDLLANGLGDEVALHVYDADPRFDFQLVSFLGQSVGSFVGRRNWLMNDDILPILMIAISFHSPVYISVPLDDTAVVDEFLENLDGFLAERSRQREDQGFIGFDTDFYTVPLAGDVTARSFGFEIGPVKTRAFWARIGDALYVASKPYILEDIARLANGEATESVAGAVSVPEKAHGLLRIRPEHWNQVLPSFRLGWAERHREACLDNVGRLSGLARMLAATQRELSQDAATERIAELADQVYDVHCFCPEGGRYEITDDGLSVACSVHGSAAAPHQPAVPADNGSIDRMLHDLAGLSVGITFLEDGLHAVLTIDRH